MNKKSLLIAGLVFASGLFITSGITVFKIYAKIKGITNSVNVPIILIIVVKNSLSL